MGNTIRKEADVWLLIVIQVSVGIPAVVEWLPKSLIGMLLFFQAVIFGYAGLRIELEHLTLNPHLPPNTHKLKVMGINYLEATFDLLVMEDRVQLVVRELSDKFPLQLRTKSVGIIWRLRQGT